MSKHSPFDEPDFVKPDLVEILTVDDALKLLDQWEESYEHLKHVLALTERDRDKWAFWAEVYKTGEKSNWILYEAALTGDDELRTALLAQIRAKV